MGENVNYARFFPNYARNLGPDHAPGQSLDPSHRRRVASVKVLLSLRLFAAVRPGLSDTCLPEIPVGARRKQTSDKGAEQGVPAPPRPAARLCAQSPAVTLLFIASLIPVGKLRIVPGELPCFWDSLPLFFRGQGKRGTTGHVTGPDFSGGSSGLSYVIRGEGRKKVCGKPAYPLVQKYASWRWYFEKSSQPRQ